MITVSINGTDGQWPQVGPQWINQQMSFWKRQGGAVCVKIAVRFPELNMDFYNGNCGPIGSGGAGSNQFSSKQLMAIEIWNRLGLNEQDDNGGKIVAFLNQLMNLL